MSYEAWGSNEPRDHYRRCQSQCEFADKVFDHDKAYERLRDAAAVLSHWTPGKDTIAQEAQTLGNQGMELLECLAGHQSHECNCEDIAHDEDGF